jgi:hypothetical protein
MDVPGEAQLRQVTQRTGMQMCGGDCGLPVARVYQIAVHVGGGHGLFHCHDARRLRLPNLVATLLAALAGVHEAGRCTWSQHHNNRLTMQSNHSVMPTLEFDLVI